MITSPRISARALLIKDNKILLTKYKDNKGYWYVMPGGGQNKGETLIECLKREVKEELDADIEVNEMLYVREIISDRHADTNLPKGFHQVEVFFNCKLIDESINLGLVIDPGQVGYEWQCINNLKEIRFFPNSIADNIFDKSIFGKYLGEMR